MLPPPLAALYRRLRQQLPAQAALAWLLLALVVVPTLGRLHQVEHAGALAQVRAGHALQSSASTQQPPAQAGRAAVSPAQGQSAAPSPSPQGGAHMHGLPGVLSLLLAPHAPADCLLLDQLVLGDALHAPPHVLPASAPAQAAPVQHAGRRHTPHIALFQARGPPAA